ncbi:MAG: cysteine hydrolase family protein [Bacteroidota bacterium]|nr:cysteine hydrolase family protein [Bacteroidota bacterium]
MKTALLLIDLQNDYFKGGTMTLVNAEQACENARLALDYFRKMHLPVIYIQHVATKPDATFFLPDTAGAEIYHRVTPAGQEKVIVKHFPNSFRETELLRFLLENGITDLVICGMMTHMCIDATTRAAKDLGFNCTLLGDACATKDLGISGHTVKASDVQTAFLAALNSTYSTVTTTKEFLDSCF